MSDEQGRHELENRHSWQQAKRMKLYSDLLLAYKERTCDDLFQASKARTCDDLLQASEENL